MPRSLLTERYVLEEPLGSGGFAEVYRATSRQSGATVAVKVLCAAEDAALRARFRQEALVLAELDHPNIVRVLDYAVEDVLPPFLVMEYVHGPSLRRLLQERAWVAPTWTGPLVEPARVVGLGRALLDALGHLHARGVVHRDVKPENAILGPTGIKLVDFGLARPSSATRLTTTTRFTVLGTPPYMAPEQALGLDVDGRSDLYSLGVVLYELLTGEWPYPGEWLAALEAGDSGLGPPPPPKPHAAVPPALGDVIWRLLCIPPAQRYADAAAAAAALAAVASGGQAVGDGVAPLPPPDPYPPSPGEVLPLPSLLAGLPAGVLRVLAGQLVDRHYVAGDTVLRQGEPGDALHLVVAGQFAVEQERPDGTRHRLAVLGPGDLFGELALIDGEPRSATVQALADGTTRALQRADFLAILRQHPDVSLGVMARLCRMVRALDRDLTQAVSRSRRRAARDAAPRD